MNLMVAYDLSSRLVPPSPGIGQLITCLGSSTTSLMQFGLDAK